MVSFWNGYRSNLAKVEYALQLVLEIYIFQEYILL